MIRARRLCVPTEHRRFYTADASFTIARKDFVFVGLFVSYPWTDRSDRNGGTRARRPFASSNCQINIPLIVSSRTYTTKEKAPGSTYVLSAHSASCRSGSFNVQPRSNCIVGSSLIECISVSHRQ